MRYYLYLFFTLFGFVACEQEEDFTPKPRAYPRIELPEPGYQELPPEYPFADRFQSGIPQKSLLSQFVTRLPEEYPYTFEYSEHAVVRPDTSNQREPYWLELIYPKLNASIHLTMKFVGEDTARFEDYINDAHTLVTKHGTRLQAIDDIVSQHEQGYGVKLYELEGDVPTVFQFSITDTTHNYFRAALYVPYANKNDSIRPILQYVRNDMMHMLETFRFRDIGQYRAVR